MPLVGTLIDVIAIALGAFLGLSTHKDLTTDWQVKIRKILGIFLIWFGLSMLWKGFNGGFWQIAHQYIVMMVALILGKMVGRGLRVQSSLNRLGRYAKRLMTLPPAEIRQPSAGFLACVIVFCAAPLATVGPLQEGLTGDCRPLIIKACMDGLAMMAFVRTFSPLATICVLPVVAFQGSFALLGQYLEPLLRLHGLSDSVTVVIGFILICISLVVLEFKKIDLSDYLPSLLIAPLLTWWSR